VATTDSTAIRVEALTKRYGGASAVHDLTFDVRAGVVTGFLGPNGAGKTTTLRILLGLARPTSGTATIFGKPYGELTDPARTVGAALEISGFHPGRSGRNHLRALALLAELPFSRVEEVLKLVELEGAADRRAGKYSLGMRQRLSLAATLLGDPQLLVLDEPANGLDPQGIRWLRDFLRRLASEGRTVLISSHVLSEVAQTVDDVIVIHHGKLVDEGPVDRLSGPQRVLVRSPRLSELSAALEAAGGKLATTADGALMVSGIDAAQVGDAAFAAHLPLHELAPQTASLEEVFLALTTDEKPQAPQ
jgi:ABC-2 type transport system ATP-binding protein